MALAQSLWSLRAQSSNFMLTLSIVIVLCTIPVRSHIQLSDPVPINAPKNPYTTWETADYDYTSPLSPDGSNFPCKGYHLTSPQPIAQYTAGQTYKASLAGSATHTGGSCQFALSYDKGESFKVIKSIIGGCPVKQGYEFTIPASAPAGKEVLFAWTWVNREGNREFYMDCAWITIESDSEYNAEIFDKLPDVYVANIKSANTCNTTEQVDVVFAPNIRGPEVEFGGGLDENTTENAGEQCTWRAGGDSADSIASQSYKASTSKPDAGNDPTLDDTVHDNHDKSSYDHGTADQKQGSRPGIFAPGARGPVHNRYDEKPTSTAVLGVLAYPSPSSPPWRQGKTQPRPIAIGEPHPIAIAGYDLYYAPGDVPMRPQPPAEPDTTVTIDVTEACPSEDAVYITVTASCTSLPDVTVTVIASTITVRPSQSLRSSSAKKTITLRRSTLYSVIPASTHRPTIPSSTWTTLPSPHPSPSSPPNGGGGGEQDLDYASGDLDKYLPCTPGAFLCTNPTEFLTCDQWRDGNANGWTWLYPRKVAVGMLCKPNLAGGRRSDLYVREGSR